MRPLVAFSVAFSLASAITLASGCTFGGLANYTIASCDPSQAQASDVCERFNTDPQTCTPFQCDAQTKHCVERTRDDDRDGDPPMRCGGTDCDDGNGARNGRAVEKCDGVDNNCNGIVDEDVLKAGEPRQLAVTDPEQASAGSLVSGDDTRRKILAAYVKSSCVYMFGLEPGSGGAVRPGCAFDDPTTVPNQPYPLRTASGYGAAFVATNVCPSGRLAYRHQGQTTTTLDLPCDAAHPAALPAVAAMPESANANTGVIAWYEAILADRAEPLAGCASIKPAPLAVYFVTPDLAEPPKTPDSTTVLHASETSLATRAPALVPIEPAGGMLLASPLGEDLGVWLLKPDNLVGSTLPTATHAPVVNARAVSVAAHVDGDLVRLALAVEVGCTPQASIRLVTGNLDPKSGAFTFDPVVDVAPASRVATSPSVAWIGSRSEWWVGWIDDAPHARVRRFTPDAKAIGGPIDVGTQVPLATVSSSESVFGVSGPSFVEIPLTCPK